MFTERIKSSPYLFLLGVVLLVAFLSAGFYILKKRTFPQGENRPPATFNELTPEEQQKVLDSLTAPGDRKLSSQEQAELIRNGSAPKNYSSMPDEELRKALDSLTAPSQ